MNMADTATKRPWEQRLHEAATTVEDELRRVVTYINDEVVPEVRQNGSKALRLAAVELERLARTMDDRAKGTGAPTPPPAEGAPRP
jgi:hypothetical protein